MKRHYCTHCQRKRYEDLMHVHSSGCGIGGKVSWACNDESDCYAAAAEKRIGIQLDWVRELTPANCCTWRPVLQLIQGVK